jgi:hypothetical protein
MDKIISYGHFGARGLLNRSILPTADLARPVDVCRF